MLAFHSNVIAMRRASVLFILLAAGCRHPDPLSHEKARAMIEASVAFQEPLEADVRKAIGY